jgi:hypothetical protein
VGATDISAILVPQISDTCLGAILQEIVKMKKNIDKQRRTGDIFTALMDYDSFIEPHSAFLELTAELYARLRFLATPP